MSKVNSMSYVDVYSDIRKIAQDYHGDKNYCSVVALSNATGWDYSKSLEWMESNEIRKRGEGMQMGMLSYFIQLLGVNFSVTKLPYSRDNKIVLSKFLKNHSKGSYIVCSRGHMFVVKDGKILDHSEKTKRQIIWAIQVEEY